MSQDTTILACVIIFIDLYPQMMQVLIYANDHFALNGSTNCPLYKIGIGLYILFMWGCALYNDFYVLNYQVSIDLGHNLANIARI